MADSLWVGAVRKGLAANRPTIPDCSSDTFQFYYATDTNTLSVGVAGGTGWFLASYTPQGTPTAKTTTTIVLTIAEMLTGIITSTQSGAVGITLPDGALVDAGVGAMAIGQSFDWTIINLGSASGAVTMNAGTAHTYVGNAVVAISTSARFRTRKTAAGTFVTYRVG